MRVVDLSSSELADRLRRGLLCLSIGPFNITFGASDASFVRGLSTLYASFPINGDDAIVDVTVRLRNERHLRTWWRSWVAIDVDGVSHGSVARGDRAVAAVEWSINWAIATRAHFLSMFHAAVVSRGDAALLLPGAPGSGKSTLSAALVGRGWRLLSDEFALVRPETHDMLPMPRPISLKNRSIDLIREKVPNAKFGPLARGTLKGDIAHMVPPADSVCRQAEVARPAWIVFPRWRPEGNAVLTPMSKGEAFVALTQSSINYSELGAVGFETVRYLIGHCDCFSFDCNDLDEAATSLAQLAGGECSVDNRNTNATVYIG